jgi:NAD dependent epimerase/dehydratase
LREKEFGSVSDAPRAVVTGAAGFIGSHLVEALLDRGWPTLALFRYVSDGSIGFLGARTDDPCLEIARGDMRDPDFLKTHLRKADIVFHLAALISIPHSYEAPREFIETNVLGTLNLLEACRNAKIRRLVHTSTSEVFGTAVYTPIDEKHPIHTQSPYAASKHAADKLVQSYICSFHVPAVTVRPFNTFGPRQSPRAVIATIIQQAITAHRIQIGNLTPRRDFTFVADTIAGLVAAAESGDHAIGMEINLGTGRDISIGEIAEMIRDSIDPSIPIESDSARLRPPESEILRVRSNNSLARNVLGWSPRISLEEGISRTIAWAREYSQLASWRGYAR